MTTQNGFQQMVDLLLLSPFLSPHWQWTETSNSSVTSGSRKGKWKEIQPDFSLSQNFSEKVSNNPIFKDIPLSFLQFLNQFR